MPRSRQTEERAERRRRRDDTLDGGQRLKLSIPLDIATRLKAEGRTPRWVNDEGNRMHSLTRMDDYDKVAGVAPVVVGTTKEGKPIKAHLCSKPAAFLAEDEAKREAGRREQESALVRGEVPNDPNSFYVADGTKIQHGGRSPLT